MQRKHFIKVGSSLLGALLLTRNSWAQNTSKSFPVIVSTWDSGMPVNAEAWKILSTNGSAIDAVEKGAILIEDDINCCVGLGGYPDRDGIVTLDASIMDGAGNCGSVAAVERIKHPISVARFVMEKTPHVLLVGAGAQQFALENGFRLEPQKLSEPAYTAYSDWLKKSEYKPTINIENKKQNGPFAPAFFDDGMPNHDTMGIVALDAQQKLAGAVTTSGMAYKIHGRVGDSPIIGAGLFVDDEVGGATSSGVGEEVIRICGTHLVVEFMRQGLTPENACKLAVERIVKRNPAKAKTLQVGFLALNKQGVHGAYAVQKGFVYSLKNQTESKIIAAKSYFN